MNQAVLNKLNTKFLQRLNDAIENKEPFKWQKPWKEIGCQPRNWLTQRNYRGINAWLLEPGEYLTFKQIKDLQEKDKNVKLKKNSKSEQIYFYSFVEKNVKNKDGEEALKKIPFLRYYNVFNIRDVEGVESKALAKSITYNNAPNLEADSLINAYADREEITLKLDKQSNSAFYQLTTDTIVLPMISQFKEVAEYYSTFFHEIGHSTGHPTRLNRNLANSFGTASYAREELIAELFAAFMLNYTDIRTSSTEQNSIAYLQSWKRRIEEDSMLIATATSRAQKAVDYFLGETEGKSEEELDEEDIKSDMDYTTNRPLQVF